MHPPKARPVVPLPTLRVTAGPLAGTIIRLEADLGTLGRRSDNTYVLAEPTVSRVHARLSRESGVVLLTDLGSSGGTRINQALVTATAVLRHGDQVGFGSVATRFEDPRQMPDGDATTEVVDLDEPATGPELSPRQLQVLERIAAGLSNREIGTELGVTERTIKAYAGEVYSKLGVSNRAGAVAAAIAHGLLEGLTPPGG